MNLRKAIPGGNKDPAAAVPASCAATLNHCYTPLLLKRKALKVPRERNRISVIKYVCEG